MYRMVSLADSKSDRTFPHPLQLRQHSYRRVSELYILVLDHPK